jgi:hypothetical protein
MLRRKVLVSWIHHSDNVLSSQTLQRLTAGEDVDGFEVTIGFGNYTEVCL